MMHLLKNEPEPFGLIMSGKKRYEIRKCEPKDVVVNGSPCQYDKGSGHCVRHFPERTFSRGDTLFLCEHRTKSKYISPQEHHPPGFTGRWVVAIVISITPRSTYGLADNVCCMGIEVVKTSGGLRLPGCDTFDGLEPWRSQP